ncbi:MAG: NADH-quinone oxidoreductase subunit J [Acidimicrobiia bacterium]|nr:NADH-quinone oxidoreductase subunit J [Acidimicrobiia bacterium]
MMWEQQVAFWILAIGMAVAAIGVVRTRNVVHAALFLVVVLAGAAGQYILLAAEFVAWVQVLIYIGAVVILFLFGIMLTRAPMRDDSSRLDNDQRWAAAAVALLVVGVLIALLVDAFGGDEIRFGSELVAQGSTKAVGTDLFRVFVVPFEVISMLLLAALVGAVVLARKD